MDKPESTVPGLVEGGERETGPTAAYVRFASSYRGQVNDAYRLASGMCTSVSIRKYLESFYLLFTRTGSRLANRRFMDVRTTRSSMPCLQDVYQVRLVGHDLDRVNEDMVVPLQQTLGCSLGRADLQTKVAGCYSSHPEVRISRMSRALVHTRSAFRVGVHPRSTRVDSLKVHSTLVAPA
jgi:hypothetical protein